MKIQHFYKLCFLLVILSVTLFTGCGKKDDNDLVLEHTQSAEQDTLSMGDEYNNGKDAVDYKETENDSSIDQINLDKWQGFIKELDDVIKNVKKDFTVKGGTGN